MNEPCAITSLRSTDPHLRGGERNISWGWPCKISISMYTVDAQTTGCAV